MGRTEQCRWWPRVQLSPELAIAIAITAWGIIWLPGMWRDLVRAIDGRNAPDFEIFASAARLAWSGGDIYASQPCTGCVFRYSPIFAYLFAPIAALGSTIWALAHLGVLFALPFRIARFVPLLWPFWWDLGTGNNITFLLVLCFWAMRGKGWAVAGVLVFAAFAPRPLIVPIVMWLLWSHRQWLIPFAAGLVASIGFALVTGHLDRWTEVLLTTGASELTASYNVGPTAIVGFGWMLAAVPLAGFALWRGRPATAGLLLQPYWLPYYLLMPLADRWRR